MSGRPPASARPSIGQAVSAVGTVFRKELLEALRDRRTVIVGVLLPVVMTPVITVGIPYLAHRQQLQFQDTPVPVAIRGQANAPDFIAFGVAQKYLQVVAAPDASDALARHQVDAVVEVSPDFAAALRAGHASVTIVYDTSSTASRVAQRRLQEFVAVYNIGLTQGTLTAHGLDLRDLTPVELVTRNVADDRRVGGLVLAGLLPFLISLWAVLGGQNTALDLGVGEKERQTLDSLLVVPAPRWTIATGKFFAVGATSMFAVLVVIATTLASLHLGETIGLPELTRAAGAFSWSVAAGILLVAIVQVAFLSSILLALSFLARGLREAQQYFTPLYLLLVFPAMVASFLEEWERSIWTYMIPAVNAAFAFRGLLLGTLTHAAFVVTVATLVAGTAVGLYVVIRLVDRETLTSRG